MTQDALADGRFTKQYVSQIERGEVVPSAELLDWLAARLGVERVLLETGVGTEQLKQIECELARGEDLLDIHHYGEALAAFTALRQTLPDGVPQATQMAALRGSVWALVRLGRITEAAEALVAERALLRSGPSGDRDRAEIAYLTGVCCYSLSQIPAAHEEFVNALALLDGAATPDDRLRIDIHQWRSRCYRRQRDWEAAHEDVERALELCEATGDARRTAEVNFQASLAAFRLGRLVLCRRYAEAARDIYEELGDRVTKARTLNNLATYNFLLENGDVAIAQLHEALAIFTDAGLDAEAGYVLSSLAQMEQERGSLQEAESAAMQALALLDGRSDHVQEVGMAQLALARTNLDLGDLETAEHLLSEVDGSFEQASSLGHQALGWVARGDLELARANDREAARLFRQAATALQPPDLERPL